MYIIDVENSLQINSHRLVQEDIPQGNALASISLPDRKIYIGYIIDIVTKTFKNKKLGFNQMNPSRGDVPLFLFWKVLYDITQFSDVTVNKLKTFLNKINNSKWGIVSVSYTALDISDVKIDTEYVDNGSAIVLCISKKVADPLSHCIYLHIFKNKIIIKSRLGMKINEDFFNTVLSETGEYSEIFNINKIILNELILDKNSNIFSDFDKEGELNSNISLFPIKLSSLKIKSAKTRAVINRVLSEDTCNIKHHIVNLVSVKNRNTYDYMHTVEIELINNITKEYVDTIYIIDNVVYFKGTFNCEDIGDIFKNVGDEYAGEMTYSNMNSFFYYTMKQRSIDDIFIPKDGITFKLELFFATK